MRKFIVILIFLGTSFNLLLAINTSVEMINGVPTICVVRTSIKYSITIPAHIELKIYSVTGQLVKTLVDKKQEAGIHIVDWFGKDNKGKDVSSGIYFCRLKAMGHTEVKKCVVMK